MSWRCCNICLNLSLKYSAEINQKIMQLSKIVSAQDLQLYYQIACKGRAELQLAVTQEQGFEMTVLRYWHLDRCKSMKL